MKKKIIILAAFVVTFFTACTSTHMITFSNAELSDKEKDMIENNSNYSTASIVGGSAKLVKEERDKAIQEKIEARRNKLKAIDGLSISSYKDKNGKEQFKATAQSEILFKFDSYELNEEAQKMLSDLCNIITEIPNTKIKGEFYQFNLSSCIRQQNSLTAQFVSFSLSNLANIFYPPQFLQ